MRLLLTKAYPNAGPPTMRELLDGSDGLFELVRLRNDRLDYAATQMAWHRNLLANRERAIELVGEEVEEMHERFMLGLARLFTRGQLDLMRLTFAAL
jgi:cyclopropane-fatty-acyl-phospholipid synthase